MPARRHPEATPGRYGPPPAGSGARPGGPRCSAAPAGCGGGAVLARSSSGVIHRVRTMPWSSAAARARLADRAAEGKAQVGDVLAAWPARWKRDRYTPTSASGVKVRAVSSSASRTTPCGGRLARVQVAGRVVQPQALGGVLLDQQVAAVALDDGGDGDARFPAGVHAGIIGRNGSGRARRPRVWQVRPACTWCSQARVSCGQSKLTMRGDTPC